MPQDTAQPQLDPGFDYAKLPDGSYAKFTKGTSQEEMRGRLIAAGKLPTTSYTAPKGQGLAKPAQPTFQLPAAYGFTPKNMAKNAWEGAKGVVKGTYDLGATMLGKPDPNKQGGNVEQTLEKVFQPMREQWKQAQEMAKQKRLSEAIGHGMAGSIPMMGPWGASLGEQAGRGDVGGAVGQAIGMGLTAKAGDVAIDKVTGFADPAVLRDRAAKLDTKVLKTAQAGAKGYKLSTALQVAKEGIYGSLKALPDKIEAKRSAMNTQVQSLTRQLDAQGITLDITNEIAPITRDVMAVANQRGTLTSQLRTQISGLLKRVTTETNMQTGAVQPRNLATMKVSDALALQKGLEDLSAFGKDAPIAINNLARRLRGVIGDKLGQVSPEMQRLRAAESNLITARDAARKNYADALNDGRTGAKGFIYSNLPTAGVYLALKGLGLPFGGAIATALVLRTLAQSTLSRTFRAAMYAKAADLLDGAISRNAGAAGPNAGVSPIGGPQLPQGGQPLTNKGVTPQNGPQNPTATPAGARGPINMGVAPSSVVTPPALSRGTLQLPEVASRAMRGSGDYVKGQKEPAGSYLAEKAKADSVAKSNIKLERQGKTKNVVMKGLDLHKIEKVGITDDMLDDSIRRHKEAWPREPEMTRAKAREAIEHMKGDQEIWRVETNHGNVDVFVKKGASETEAIGEAAKIIGQNRMSGKDVLTPTIEQAKSKAMMDRLDTLYERQSNPKSGADRNAIEREITEIKRVLSGDAKGADASGINKRIADRERLAGKRATAKAETPGTQTGSQTGTTAEPATRSSASPENRAMLLDMGYKKIATYDGGPEMATALRKHAKDMIKADPSFDEVTALAEALNALKEVSGK